MNFRNKKHKPLEISLTPMIDVVFLLLIFFMVTTTFSRQPGIKVTLPQADGEETEQQQQQQAVLLTIDKTSRYSIDNKPLSDNSLDTSDNSNSLDTLMEELKASKKDRHIPLIIKADAEAPVQLAISVLEVASKINFSSITFETQKRE